MNSYLQALSKYNSKEWHLPSIIQKDVVVFRDLRLKTTRFKQFAINPNLRLQLTSANAKIHGQKSGLLYRAYAFNHLFQWIIYSLRIRSCY